MKKQIVPPTEFRQQGGQYVSAPARYDVNTQFPDTPLSQFSQTGSIDAGLTLTGQGYGVYFAKSLRIRRHEVYPHIHVLSFRKEQVCWDFIAAFRKDLWLQEAARSLVDSMKELRQDYKDNAPTLHAESCGHFYGRNRILNNF